MEDPISDLSERDKRVLQALNGLDAGMVAATIGLALYNCISFVRKPDMRRSFIIIFYILVFFCLISWEFTAIA